MVFARFNFRNCEGGCYEIKNLPDNRAHLFIRPCYIDMAEVFFESTRKLGPDVVPFVGTAGIGKS